MVEDIGAIPSLWIESINSPTFSEKTIASGVEVIAACCQAPEIVNLPTLIVIVSTDVKFMNTYAAMRYAL